MSAFQSGLEGVVVAQTEISEVDGERGRLIYRGGNLIEGVWQRNVPEIAHLLWYGRFPTAAELADLERVLASRRALNPAARAALAGLPVDADPMDALRTLLSAAGAGPGCPSPSIDQAKTITAQAATALAAFWRHRRGLPPVEPCAELGHAENLLYMMRGERPTADEVRWLEAYLVITADHALSPSTFTAQIVGSAGGDLWSAIVAAISTLKGPAHGGAIAAATAMLADAGTPENAERFVVDLLDRGGRLMGFGHREYRVYDPRARLLGAVCREANPAFHEVASAVEEAALRELARRYPHRPNFTNVDFFAGGILSRLGFDPDFFACVFAAARVVGWSAHVVEYLDRGGRIISPKSEWIGPEPASDPG
ncbi:citrate/2-methylcitrate synthase [Phytohabitans houttuyneae]|uniref:Citrate synthase n=1 Tax=Phytohabitans houttuyneae TaxID=1076126 RepID=A0A6V8K2S8_9ACTN|nr:citrate/2-methylcitrate synthase [Phytohabitans houttuyneae]GFJ78024.1 citrate synthase 1 [Phytohabitans houttuyneae]